MQKANPEAMSPPALSCWRIRKNLRLPERVAQVSEKTARLQQAALGNQRAWGAENIALKSRSARSRLPPVSSLPHGETSNPWFEGNWTPRTEGGFFVLHRDDLEFAPEDDCFPDVWVRLIVDITNKKDVMVNVTLL